MIESDSESERTVAGCRARPLGAYRAGAQLAAQWTATRKDTTERMEWNNEIGGSFSPVSTATIARNDAFFSIFRDLQDLYTFTRSDHTAKNSSEFLLEWNEISF